MFRIGKQRGKRNVNKKERLQEMQELKVEQENLLSDKSNFFIREAYKTLRTNVLFSLTGDSQSKVLMVSSSMQGEGKSFTALNLAISLAQTEKKVLLIDCDLRRPKIFRLLQMSAESGLSNVLMDTALLKESILPTMQPNLSVLLSGDVPPNPSELLGSARMARLLELLRKEYDYILLDTPPINAVTDATVMVPETDGVLFVVRSGRSERSAVMHALNQLKYAGGHILGFVMNDVGVENSKHSSYKKYGGYGYYRQEDYE